MSFEIEFDFDGGVTENGQFVADAPHEYIIDNETGMVCFEVLEDPTPTVEFPDTLDKHWQAGPIALRLVALLNEHWERDG